MINCERTGKLIMSHGDGGRVFFHGGSYNIVAMNRIIILERRYCSTSDRRSYPWILLTWILYRACKPSNLWLDLLCKLFMGAVYILYSVQYFQIVIKSSFSMHSFAWVLTPAWPANPTVFMHVPMQCYIGCHYTKYQDPSDCIFNVTRIDPEINSLLLQVLYGT